MSTQPNTRYIINGWLLDVYADRRDGMFLWIVCEDGRRLRIKHRFPVSFCVSGDYSELRKVWTYVKVQLPDLTLRREPRKELFKGEMDVLSITVDNPYYLSRVYRQVRDAFPGLEYYDADLQLGVRYCAVNAVFPLAHVQVEILDRYEVKNIRAIDSQWDPFPQSPPLRILALRPDTDPNRQTPSEIILSTDERQLRIPFESKADVVATITAHIEEFDPDIVASHWGDSWLFPKLNELAEAYKVNFNPNRDKSRSPLNVPANQYFSYGRVVHRDQQTLLFGRLHIDPKNSFTYNDYGIQGILEMARVTRLPIQNAARRSPGGGFTAMQVTGALNRGILVPTIRRQREPFRAGSQMVVADNGGMVYQPIPGIYGNVIEIDFFSMYPSIMKEWNISPETVGEGGEHSTAIPGIDKSVTQEYPGLVAEIMAPVLEKRRAIKAQLGKMSSDDPRYSYLEALSGALKWQGLVSFGYQGFSGNRIGSISAHESITAVGREALLKAKAVAENLGYEVLHMYVDSLFVYRKDGSYSPQSAQNLVSAIKDATGLKLDLEGRYHWLAILPSKQDPTIPVPNCFFGYFDHDEVKLRGVMARRNDVPAFIQDAQRDLISLLTQVHDVDDLSLMLPQCVSFLREKYAQLHNKRANLKDLVLAQMLSRELGDYKVASPAARAAKQLADAGHEISAGMAIRYIHTRGAATVIPWNLADEHTRRKVNWSWYKEQLGRAGYEVLQIFGIGKSDLARWLGDQPAYFSPQDFLDGAEKALPLFEYNNIEI